MIQISAQTASPGSILIFPCSWCVRGSGGVLPGPAGATEKKFEDKSPSGFLILRLILCVCVCVLYFGRYTESLMVKARLLVKARPYAITT